MKKRLYAFLLAFVVAITTVIPVSAQSSVAISKNSITIQSGDTYQLRTLVNGKPVSAAAWGSSDPSVADVSQTGLVKGKAAGSAVITAMVQGRSVECIVSVVKRSKATTTRYNVLILDTSGSVRGLPLKRQKEAAKRFCKKVLSSKGRNYLAVVSLNTDSKIECGFTSDAGTLYRKINSLKAKGGTNINAAFQKAGSLLGRVKGGSHVMKNVILCSDGLPESGVQSVSGRYDKKDHRYYKYANATYKTDVKLKHRDYFIYALGFFHNSKSNDLKFGKRLMKDLASKDKYYIVTDPDDVDKVLDDIANKITKTTINKKAITLYEKQTYQLKVQVNGVTKKAGWKSGRPSVATVSSTGKVTARKAGTTIVTGTVNGKSVTCKVTVKARKKPATLRLSRSRIDIYLHHTAQLKAYVTGKSKKVKWSVENEKIASVDQKGNIKALKVGKTNVVVRANGLKRVCEVRVIVRHPVYSQYFMLKPTVSKYGSTKINEYGVRLVTNEDAKIEKCAVYIDKQGTVCKRTLACKGENITYARYVPYLAKNGKIIYDGLTTYGINTFYLSQNYHGVWTYNNYTMITANLEDQYGKPMSVSYSGISGKNTRIFYNKQKMIDWMNK